MKLLCTKIPHSKFTGFFGYWAEKFYISGLNPEQTELVWGPEVAEFEV